MADRDILDMINEYEGNANTSAPLPTELPEGYADPSLKPNLAPEDRQLEEYRVRFAAQEAGIDPDIAAAAAFQESSFNPDAVSRTGVRGTMQVTKRTANGLGYDRDDYDGNIRAGVALLKQGMDKYPNDINKALSIYPDPKDRNKWVPSVVGHSIRAKENRKNSTQTIEDALAGIPDDIFDVKTNDGALRPDGTPKGNGFLGPLQRPDGNISTELSIGVDIGGQEALIPSIVPTLTKEELDSLLAGGEMTPEIVDKATKHAQERMSQGLSPFASEGELTPLDSTSTGTIPPEGTQSLPEEMNSQEYLKTIIPTIMGGQVPQLPDRLTDMASTAGMGGSGIQGGAMAIPRNAAQQVMNAIPGMSKIASKATQLPKAAKYLLGLSGSAAEGAAIGALTEGGYNDDATAESIKRSAKIGAAIPLVLKPVASTIKYLAGKTGDLVIGKTDMGKWVMDKFGTTKSLKSLSAKNQSMYTETEAKLQQTLNKYSDVNIAVPKDTLSPDIIRQTIKEAVSDRAPKAVIDQLEALAVKLESSGTLNPAELNIIKRSLYTDAYTAAGKMKGSAYAKNTAKIASSVRQIIEDNTDDTVALLNQEEAKHIALSSALSKKLNKSLSAWSLMTKVLPAASAGGLLGFASGGPAGVAATAATMAAQTVPGFTTMGAAGQALENPDLQRILSTLLPQLLK